MVKALNERKPSMLRLRHRIEPASRYNAVGRVACLEVGMGDFGFAPFLMFGRHYKEITG